MPPKTGPTPRTAIFAPRKPKSILCLPILHQDKLLAIVYLENNLIPGAFTTDRLELLNVLTSQAAISMEIARHIEQVGEQERLKKRDGGSAADPDRHAAPSC